MGKSDTPLRIYCKNCGSPAGFDIVHQSYRCTSCGELTGIAEANQKTAQWKKLQTDNTKEALSEERAEERSCPSCGATIVFKAGEAAENCVYCGSKLISKKFMQPENIPELIIPFFITFDEAKKRMLEWGHKNEKSIEGRSVVSSMGNFKGAYVPYVLVKGPVSAKVLRSGTEREYSCMGYIEGTAVSTSAHLDNEVLNAAEPFDWSQARPFELGYIAGQNVKFATLPENSIKARIGSEAAEDFLPLVEKEMQTKGVELLPRTGDMMALSVLLPIYYIKSGELTAVMNGQTGRIAVSKKREKKSYPWALEPALYTIIATVLASIPYKFAPEAVCMFFMFFGILFFAIMSDGQNSLIKRITVKSENAKAKRENDELKIDEKKDILKNPYENTPVFIEKNEKGETVPVRIRFYTPGRILYTIVNMFVTVFLPAIIAFVLRLMGVGSSFNIGYGAAWYVLAGVVVLVYFTKGLRRDIYEHPVLYEIKADKKLRRIKNERFKPSVLNMIKRYEDISIFEILRLLGGAGVFLGVTVLFLIIGSVAAILD